ncbi:MAG: glycosyltransferase [Acetatifactor sp.]|nr:glycosyltransferase [Acetatifactor sp.]
MDNTEIVSVVIPVYNVEKYVERCVESVINQSYRNLQIIIVNDGSLDSSAAISHEIEKTDSRVIVIDKTNGGLSSARNAGKRISKGKYILFVDSDDWLERNAIEELVRTIECQKLDLVVFGYFVDYENSKTTRIISTNEEMMPDNYTQEEIIFNLLETGLINLAWNKLYKMDFVQDMWFDEKTEPIEDILFNSKVFSKKPQVGVLKKPLYHYVKDGQDSILTRYKKGMLELSNRRSNAIRKIIDSYQMCGEHVDKYLAKEYLDGKSDCILNNYRTGAHVSFKEKVAIIYEIKHDEDVRKAVFIRKGMNNGFAANILAKVLFLPAWMISMIYELLFIMRKTFKGLYTRFRGL